MSTEFICWLPDLYVSADGVREWFHHVLWHRSKQEIHPRVSHFYGDLVGRMLAALRGRSSKRPALDLDNTLWGGVIGDDGLEGIQLVRAPRWVKRTLHSNITFINCHDGASSLPCAQKITRPMLSPPSNNILTWCSSATDKACSVANWQDKASNLRDIAETLNIGLDSLVFADDNPFERNLIRQELPAVQVPELPDDPSLYVTTLAKADILSREM